MDRRITNIIRFFMDECIPPIIRDSRWFMYPFFYYAYRGKNLKQVMDFKSLLYSFSDKEYSDFYNALDTISRNRVTDLNEPSIDRIISSIDQEDASLLDVGCGHGYLLNRIKKARPGINLSGCDIKPPSKQDNFNFIEGDLVNLKFPSKSFDVVTCCHTVEHILKPEPFIEELKRIARRKVIIVVPCQRYFYYTLDEHINFFPYKEKLTSLMNCKTYECEKVFGDWVFVGTP